MGEQPVTRAGRSRAADARDERATIRDTAAGVRDDAADLRDRQAGGRDDRTIDRRLALRRDLTGLAAALDTALERLRSRDQAEPPFGDVQMASLLERTLGVIATLRDELDALDDGRIAAAGDRRFAERDRERSAHDRQYAASDRGAAQRDRDDDEADEEQREVQAEIDRSRASRAP
jgi:hypothetical protein